MKKSVSTRMLSPIHCLFYLFIFMGHAKSQLYDQEHAILLKIKQYLENPAFLSHWIPTDSSHCSWPEITCTGNSVTGLSLQNTNITQTIPPFICDLKNLTHVDFHLNYFPGEFPRFLYNCSKLEYLDLSQNNFVGKVPDDIDNLSNLRFLSLGGNSFSGDIPASIGRLKELRTLELYQCLFNGTLPAEIGSLSNLEMLDLRNNMRLVPSPLPSIYTQLKNLKNLWMYQTNLIGEIPETIGDMVALEVLDLSINNLTGKIPSGLFTLKNLTELYLYHNKLSGEIPGVIEAFNLKVLDLSENNLTGKLSDDLGKLKNLNGMFLQMNQLSGELPVSIGTLPSLTDFRIFSNNLSGTLPPDFGRYSMLKIFEVSVNNLTGTLPENLCYNGKLIGLSVYANNFSGAVPQGLGNCNSLQYVYLYSNGFSGKIPDGLWTANLSFLMMSNNKLTGELPDRLASNLTRLEISNNQFHGKIPVGVSFCKNLRIFEASNNLLNDTIPQELTALPLLETLLLDQNQLSGSLPSEIISWSSLVNLNLSRNFLSGQIPQAIGKLSRLSGLDLSGNQLSGSIPSQIALPTLVNLNLSSNILTGMVPSQLETGAFVSSFLNNPGLCATTSSINLKSCNSVAQQSRRSSSVSLALILSLVMVASVMALLSMIMFIRVYTKRKQGLDSTWKLTSFQKLTFTESTILSGLIEDNIVGSGGSGSVYRVVANHSGHTVAVKKIWSDRKLEYKLENEFLAEVEILSSIRHANIVKLLCCISSENSKLLVYEYVQNSSLDRWLHGTHRLLDGRVSLDWPKRLQIAIGAAQGLSYMHHDCSPIVVHRDVKSSNILLDSGFNAKVADFGLAKLLTRTGELATMSAVAGSFGYIAPEYAQTTKVNEKIDVYSFGVILLELTTGKEANYGDEYTSLADWAWRHIKEGIPISDALDEEIKEPCYLDEMCSVFKLGVICTSSLPSSRPSMKEVSKVLVQCSQPLVLGEKNMRGNLDAVPLLKNSRRETKQDDDNSGSLATYV